MGGPHSAETPLSLTSWSHIINRTLAVSRVSWPKGAAGTEMDSEPEEVSNEQGRECMGPRRILAAPSAAREHLKGL